MKFPALLWSDMLPGHCHFLLLPVTHPMGLPPASSLHSEFCTREGIHTQFHKGSAEGTLHSLLTRVALAVDSPPESWQAGWEVCISNICLFSTQGVLPYFSFYHLGDASEQCLLTPTMRSQLFDPGMWDEVTCCICFGFLWLRANSKVAMLWEGNHTAKDTKLMNDGERSRMPVCFSSSSQHNHEWCL